MIYWVVCERLEAIDRVTDAIECFHEMMSKLGGEVYMSEPMTERVSGELCSTCLSAIYSTFLVRFHPSMSLCSRERR
jgi:hypothetical protein